MSFFATVLGVASSVAMSAATRFLSPKEIVVDIGMKPSLFVQANLKKKLNLKYHFARKDQVIARKNDGWRIAQGRKWLILTEHYVDKRNELILMCKEE
jgi:hypothetical protein